MGDFFYGSDDCLLEGWLWVFVVIYQVEVIGDQVWFEWFVVMCGQCWVEFVFVVVGGFVQVDVQYELVFVRCDQFD